MKKFIISFFLLLGIICYSQTYTKKYNSLSRQYEYFDSRGSMIGYEVYNNVTRQWEYYEVKQRQAYQYRDPAPVDMSSTFQAQSILQNRYDNNTNYLRQEVSKMEQYVYDLDIPDSQKSQILQAFQDVPLKSINSQTINYSNSNTTNEVVNYLRKSLGKIINNVTSVKTPETKVHQKINYNDPSSSAIRNKQVSIENANNYNKEITVSKIVHFINSKNIQQEEKIDTSSYIILTENEIKFKNAKGDLLFRNLTDKKYLMHSEEYVYKSNWGAVAIHKDLDYVIFYEGAEPYGDNYVYYIKTKN